MKTLTPSYRGFRFPSEIFSHAVWLYCRFYLIFHQVEALRTKRGISVTYESIRQWCQNFGPDSARKLKKRQGRLSETWPIDEVFFTIQGQLQDLWRAVDQDGDCLDIAVQLRRNQRAAERFFRRLLKGQGGEPRWLGTHKLRSYDAAHRTIMPSVNHINHVYAKNRTEVWHKRLSFFSREIQRRCCHDQNRFLMANPFCWVHVGRICGLFLGNERSERRGLCCSKGGCRLPLRDH